MKKNCIMRHVLAILFIAFLFSSCEKEFYSLSDIDQPVIFKVEYQNHAWGYSHEGYLIDKIGAIRPFDKPDEWNYPDSEGYITYSELNQNVNQLVDVFKIIDEGLLLKYLNKLYRIDPSDLSEQESTSRDAGVISYSGFIYEVEKEKYKEVKLKVAGDISYVNTNREANLIYKWLQGIYEDL
ncbi:MAG: hypothetical protein R6U52_09140 [Kosmotogaceae bacterium]